MYSSPVLNSTRDSTPTIVGEPLWLDPPSHHGLPLSGKSNYGSQLGFAEEKLASPSPILGGETRRKSYMLPMTENGGKKGQFTSALIWDNSNLFLDNSSSYLSQEDNDISKHETKRLVKLGREVERKREERKKKRNQFKNICNKFRKDVDEYLKSERIDMEKEKMIDGRSLVEDTMEILTSQLAKSEQ